MYLNHSASLFSSPSWLTKNLSTDWSWTRSVHAGVASLLVAVSCIVSTLPVVAQTSIYDGSQQLNYFDASHLTDDLMLTNNPADPTRNGVVNSGSDPNVLEQGDAAWFRSTGRRMRNTNVGLASTAIGVDGDFMSIVSVPSDLSVFDTRGAGAGYVLYDAGATTGPQILNFSLYYNDPTPNEPEGVNNGTGGNVAVRVRGVQDTGVANDPWDTDEFTYLAASGGAAGWISAGNHRDNSGEGAGPQVDDLLFADSSMGAGAEFELLPSADWQSISLPFDAGSGYDYLIFSFGAVVQDEVIGPDRFAFDNISYEAAPITPGDFDQDGDVDGADFLEWQRNDGSAVSLADWQSNYGPSALSASSVPEPTSLILIGLAFSTVTGCGRRCT